MPLVAAGNFAYVYKLQLPSGNRAIKCFRQFLGDRERRYGDIDRYLDKVDGRLPALAKFEYESEGILVGPQRYPVLVMEWVEGPPLDVYIGALLKQQSSSRAAIESLAQAWCQVVKQLEDNGVAHGDLQHRNAIVTPAGIRLVDLDGMFVPSLTGRKAAELGHQHFQHPLRTPEYFDATLDRFPSLVVYVSLMALSKAPDLWATYNDDNLLFTSKDFKDPNASPLFRAVDKLGGEEASLSRLLRQACSTAPTQSPRLSSLVRTKGSKLPAWMTGGGIVSVPTTTRESSRPAPSAGPVSTSPTPVSVQPPAWPTSNPQPSTKTQSVPPKASVPAAPSDYPWIKLGLAQSLGLVVPSLFFFWIWVPAFGYLLDLVGVGQKHPDRILWMVVLYIGTCLTLGFWRSSRKRPTTSGSQSSAPTGPPSTASTLSRPIRRSGPATPYAPAGPAVVGSTIRMVYHRQSCEWAVKISRRNRTIFPSIGDARSRGYRPCRVCNP
jgi:metal binding Ada-like protein